MQLKDKSGIACDCCGGPQRHDFVYYSLDFQQVDVQDGRFPPGWLDHLDRPPVFSIDACPTCMRIIEETVKVNFKPMRGGIGCELCPAVMCGQTFTFYCCRVTKVSVSLTHGQQRCVCGQPVPAQSGAEKEGEVPPCQRCGRRKVVKSAAISTDDKYLQVMVCPLDYSKLTDNALRLRNLAGQQR